MKCVYSTTKLVNAKVVDIFLGNKVVLTSFSFYIYLIHVEWKSNGLYKTVYIVPFLAYVFTAYQNRVYLFGGLCTLFYFGSIA